MTNKCRKKLPVLPCSLEYQGMDDIRPRPREYEYTEGKDAARRFEGLVKTVMTAPPAQVQKREKAGRKKNRKR